MSKCVPVLLFLLLLVAPGVHAQEPRWLTDARAREGRDLKDAAVSSADGVFTARALGRLLTGSIVEESGSYEFQIDIGSEAPVVCEVMVEAFDLAAMLRATADLTFERLEPLGTIEARAIERTDAGAYGGAAYISLDWLYRMREGDQARLGGLKQAVVSKNDRGIYCAHLDIGFSSSFQAAVRTLAESLQFTDSEPLPYFTEISVATLQGEKVGVNVVTMERDEDGDTLLTTKSSLAIRVAADTLMTQDAYDSQWVRPDGSLIVAYQVSSENGEIDANLSLSPTADGPWLVRGVYKGKAIAATIEPPAAPGTVIQQARGRRGLFGREDAVGTELTAAQWTTVDPTRILESRTTVLSVLDADRLAARETLEGISVDLVLERTTGMPSRTVVQIGPASIEMDRVYLDGAF